MSVASAERICEVLNEKSDITNPENADKTVPDGSITFDHVTFRYSKTSAKPVLSDIDLSIKSGETIGIIGGTGSSKSSLVNLISRLYDVSEGRVLVGGKDVRSYDLDTPVSYTHLLAESRIAERNRRVTVIEKFIDRLAFLQTCKRTVLPENRRHVGRCSL